MSFVFTLSLQTLTFVYFSVERVPSKRDNNNKIHNCQILWQFENTPNSFEFFLVIFFQWFFSVIFFQWFFFQWFFFPVIFFSDFFQWFFSVNFWPFFSVIFFENFLRLFVFFFSEFWNSDPNHSSSLKDIQKWKKIEILLDPNSKPQKFFNFPRIFWISIAYENVIFKAILKNTRYIVTNVETSQNVIETPSSG